MRGIISSLLALFTIVGGHFYNRRLDIGLLFFVLLIVLGIGAAIILPLLLSVLYNEQMWDESVISVILLALPVIMVGLMLSSAVVSYTKARGAVERPPLGKVGVVGALLTTLLSGLIVFWIGYLGIQYAKFADFDSVTVLHDGKEDALPEDSITVRTSYFHEMVRFGGKWIPDQRLDPLPEGAAFITGRIRFEDRPVVGANLIVVINSRYLSKEITTDEQGHFALAVPDGEWTLNRIELKGWPERPHEGSFTVTGGPNPVLSETMFHAGPSFDTKGLVLKATSEPVPLPQLELIINSNVRVLWPQRSRQLIAMEQDKVSWEALEGASHYQLQLHRVERDGRSMSYYPVAWINTDTTEVPMSSFQTVSDDLEVENEYAVDVFAFDAEGQLLAGSSRFIGDRSLVLKGSQVVATHDYTGLVGLPDMSKEEFQESIEQAHQDKKRLQAADTLVHEGLADAARVLIERVESPSLEERKLRTMGLILAAEGRCVEARAKLEAANERREKPCYPELFTERCNGDE